MSISALNERINTTHDINTQEELVGNTTAVKYRQSHMPQKFIVIWLDPNIDESNDKYHDSIIRLRHIVNTVQLFTDVDRCIEFITNIEDGRFFFILSDTVGMPVMSLINDLPQIDSIYIFCAEEIKSEQNVSGWKKIKGIFNDTSAIFDQLQQKFRYYEQDLISTNIFSTGFGPELDELNQSFMYSVLLKEILIEMNYDEKAKTNFFELYRAQHSEYQIDWNRIDEIEKSYDEHTPIWWYIKKPFIYSTLNKALRTQDVTTIIKMGFYLKDLHQQIERVYSTVNQIEKVSVYRGQNMAKNEFEKMKKSKGGLLSFNDFLSTTTERKIALGYANNARDDPHLVGILFDMEIDPMISKTSFATLKNVDDFSAHEDEILFSMHTVFRIGDMEEIDNHIWNVKLIMTSDTDTQLERLTDRIREEIQGPNELHRLGNLLMKMGQFDEAEETYNTLLVMLPKDDSNELAYIYNQLGNIMNEKGHLELALSFLQKTLEIKQRLLSSNDSDLATVYSYIGSVYNKMGQYSEALSFYEKALEIMQNTLPSDHPDLASSYNNMGLVYDKIGEYSKALSYYEKTLEIRQQILPPNHPDLAITYNNIGSVHQTIGDYPRALIYLEKTLEIQQKTLPSNHPDLATTFDNIGWVHHSIGQYCKALSYLEKSLQIRQVSLPANHPDLATTYNIIGLVYNSEGEFEKSLSYFEKTLRIFQMSLPSHHPSLADTYNNMGSIYQAKGEYSKALSHYEKTLAIREQSLPSNHPDFAITYKNIGSIYNNMGEYSNALSMYEKTLQIQQASLPSNHPSLADTYNNIGRAHGALGAYLNAIACYKKALKIQQVVFPSNHPSLATTYNDIGRAHAAQKNYGYALQYYQDALKIQEQVLSSNHPSLAETYNSVGDMYRLTGDCAAALPFYDKTLTIQKAVLPLSHPSIAITYSNMGQLHRSMKKYERAKLYMEEALKIQSESLPPYHPSLAASHYHMATILEGLERYQEMVKHASQAVNIISHSIEPNQAQAKKYQEYLIEIMDMTGVEDAHKKKEREEWTYPILLVRTSSQESLLQTILKNITNDCLIPPVQLDQCIDKLRSDQHVMSLVLEVSSISVEERDSVLKDVSSFESVETIYLLGKPPETREQRNEFFNDFDKVCMFCEDADQLAVQLTLDMASTCRISGNECAEAGDKRNACKYFQRGMDLYDGLKKLIGEKPRTVS